MDRARRWCRVWDTWAITRALGDSTNYMVVVERPGQEQMLVLLVLTIYMDLK